MTVQEASAWLYKGEATRVNETWERINEVTLSKDEALLYDIRAEPLFKGPDMHSLPIGTPALKVGGSYQAVGVIVGNFKTRAGEQRYVFEFVEPAGMLHIFGSSQVKAIE